MPLALSRAAYVRFDWNGAVHFLLLPGRQHLAMEECDTKRPHQQQVASHYEWLGPQVYARVVRGMPESSYT
jgi:hypothetical protein